MGDVTFRAEVNETKTAVKFEMIEDGQVKAGSTMDAQQVEDLLRNFAAIRATLADQVPGELEPSFRLSTIPSPAWRIPDETNLGDGKLLALRHPGYGWLGFYLESTRAKEIGNWLYT